MSPNSRIVLNILATYGRSLFSLGCGLFSGRWVLIALGAMDWGLYGLIGGLTAFIEIFNAILSVSIGRFYGIAIGRAQIKGNEESGLEECRKWFNTALALHIIFPLCLIVLGYPIGVYAIEHWLTIPSNRIQDCVWVFRFVCFSCFVGMANVPFRAMYIAKQYIAELTIYSIIQTICTASALYYMASHPGVWLVKYALCTCLIVVIPQILICIRAFNTMPECKCVLKYLFSSSRLRGLAYFGGWNVFGLFGGLFRNQGMQILTNKFFGPQFNASMSTANLINGHAQNLSSALLGAFQPVITTSCGSGNYLRMKEFAYKACKFAMIFGLIFFIPLFFELDIILKTWLVDPPPSCAPLCRCIILATILDKASSGHLMAVSAMGRIAVYQIVLGGCLILALPLAWALAAYWEADIVHSVGFAIVVSMAVCSMGRVYMARWLVGLSIRRWFLEVFSPILAGVTICSVVCCPLKLFMPPTFLRVIVVAVLSETVFLPFVWLFVLEQQERQYGVEKLQCILRKYGRFGNN